MWVKNNNIKNKSINMRLEDIFKLYKNNKIIFNGVAIYVLLLPECIKLLYYDIDLVYLDFNIIRYVIRFMVFVGLLINLVFVAHICKYITNVYEKTTFNEKLKELIYIVAVVVFLFTSGIYKFGNVLFLNNIGDYIYVKKVGLIVTNILLAIYISNQLSKHIYEIYCSDDRCSITQRIDIKNISIVVCIASVFMADTLTAVQNRGSFDIVNQYTVENYKYSNMNYVVLHRYGDNIIISPYTIIDGVVHVFVDEKINMSAEGVYTKKVDFENVEIVNNK